MKKKYALTGICMMLGLFLFAQETLNTVYEGVEFDMPRVPEPEIPDYAVSIVDYGAVSGGQVKNTEAIARAIGAVAEKGGGKVVIPRGIWLTGPVTLQSRINLHLEAGALLQFSSDFDDYLLVATSFEGLDTYRCISPINGVDLENVAITGSGTIDGNGDAWRQVKKSKMTDAQWKAHLKKWGGVLSEDGKTWYPSEKSLLGAKNTGNFNVPMGKTPEELAEVKDFLRPVMVSIVRSKNVLLEGVTFQNSPAWNLHPLMCENVILRDLNVRNPWYSQNGDGLDLESCKNALIYNNTFDVGDDAICIKSGKDADGRRRAMPTENVIVKNNIVYHGHGGFVVGSEMSGGVKNVHVSKCTFMGTDVGLRFKSTRGRGGVVEHIYISDIDMTDIPAEPIRFNLFYGGQSPVLEEGQKAAQVDEVPVPVTEETPSFRNISMKNIRAIRSGTAGYFQGLPEMSLKNIRLENVYLEATRGISIIDAEGIVLVNVEVQAAKGDALVLYNVTDMSVNGFGGGTVKVLGRKSERIRLAKSDFADGQVTVGDEVSKKAVSLK